MTCIVGVRQNGRVWVGGDSASIAGWLLTPTARAKVVQRGPCLIGVAGSVRVSNLLAHAFEPPPLPADGDLLRYMVVDWINVLRECLKGGGVASQENNAEVLTESALLVGVRGRLFEVDSDYQVNELRHPYAAVGSGAQVALGALAVSAHLPPAARCRAALRAAELHNIGVRGPFVVRSCREEGAA